MDQNQLLMTKHKLEFSGIIKESLRLFLRNLRLVALAFLTSFPYLCFSLFLELNFLHTLFHTIKSKLAAIYDYPSIGVFTLYRLPRTIDVVVQLVQDVFLPALLPGFLYLGTVHLLHLLTTIVTVHCSSIIYAGQDKASLKEMLCTPFRKVGLKGPLITSIYALLLTSLILIGIVSLSTHLLMTSGVFRALFVLLIVAFLIKYIEWSSIWTMGMVISVLEEKHGDVAIGVSAYISRGSRKRGFLLMLVLFVWWVCLKSVSVYGIWSESGSMVVVSFGEAMLVCLGNVMEWISFTVYYYDCKKRFLEKKVDVENAISAQKS